MAARLVASLLACYLLGSVSFAYLFAKAVAGKDLRQVGTGNLGGRNVSRILGKTSAVAVIVLDMAKGALSIWLTSRVAGPGQWVAFLAMATVLLGHNYSVLLGFKGGKGLASGFGALLVLNPPLLAFLVAAAVVTLAATRDVYKAALAIIFLLVPAVIYVYPGEYATWLAALAAAVVVMSRHMRHLA